MKKKNLFFCLKRIILNKNNSILINSKIINLIKIQHYNLCLFKYPHKNTSLPCKIKITFLK